MGDRTGIEWTDSTWNPVTGCVEVSPGCDNCYAKRVTERFRGPGSFANVERHDTRLDQPLRWRRPRRVFVNSMSDLFHDDVPDEFIARVFAVMALTPRHQFQVLTKRHGRMRSLLNDAGFRDAVDRAIPGFVAARRTEVVWYDAWPLPNVWLGVSVEDQKWAGIRVPALLDTPAAVRFLSCEPLLGRVALRSPWHDYLEGWTTEQGHATNCQCGGGGPAVTCPVPVQVRTARVDWVIAGGESGPGARPMHPDWARALRDDCAVTGTAYLFKQWGAWTPVGLGDLYTANVAPDGTLTADRGAGTPMRRVGKHAAGRELDGALHDGYPA